MDAGGRPAVLSAIQGCMPSGKIRNSVAVSKVEPIALNFGLCEAVTAGA